MRIATALLNGLPPEVAHRAAIRALAAYPCRVRPDIDPRLGVEAFGLSFPNPLGLAAGFDKSAEAVDGLSRIGFGFVEVGTLTPKAQTGNAKPRLFRLSADGAIVNRMGFNNEGFVAARARLSAARARGIVGINIGPNKDSLADYFVLNISSPNTPGLRNLHARDEFASLIDAVLMARERASPRRPVLVKIAPDLNAQQLEDVLAIAMAGRVDGLVVSNTSVGRPASLTSAAAKESGGLSGRPIFGLSTRLVAQCFLRCGPALPIIGVGGVQDAQTAIAKFEAGASLVQIYTGLIYRGPMVIREILRGLSAEIERRGLPSLAAVVGSRTHEIAAGG